VKEGCDSHASASFYESSMAYDKSIAERVRKAIGREKQAVEKRMFGGIAFMVSGHMSCGVIGNMLMVRVGPGQYEQALKRPHAREMDFTRKPMRGLVYVSPPGFDSDKDLAAWVTLSMNFIAGLPPKPSGTSQPRRKTPP
jgi:TfoX/Sxy family transcriptional regulator of competence genes